MTKRLIIKPIIDATPDSEINSVATEASLSIPADTVPQKKNTSSCANNIAITTAYNNINNNSTNEKTTRMKQKTGKQKSKKGKIKALPSNNKVNLKLPQILIKKETINHSSIHKEVMLTDNWNNFEEEINNIKDSNPFLMPPIDITSSNLSQNEKQKKLMKILTVSKNSPRTNFI